MSSGQHDTYEALEQNLAFARGLESESPTEVSSAAYICAELNGLPKLEDDFEFKRGFGISSESIQLNLAFLYDELKKGEYDQLTESKEKGALLREYKGDLIDLALYLYKENNPEREPTNSWQNALKEIEGREEELLEKIDEISERLN